MGLKSEIFDDPPAMESREGSCTFKIRCARFSTCCSDMRSNLVFCGQSNAAGGMSPSSRKRTVGLSCIVRSSKAAHGGQLPQRPRMRQMEYRVFGSC